MARPFPRTLALVAGISVTIAGCTTPIEPAADQALPAEESSTSSPATPPGSLDVALPDLGVEAPEAGTDAWVAWFALLSPEGEYAASAMYQAVIDEFGPVEPYVSIREGEERHIDALTRQLERLGYEVPANPYLGEVSAPSDLQSAAEAWAVGEIANVEMYDELLGLTVDASLTRVLENLRRASLESHLPLFELAAANGGSLTADQMPSRLGAGSQGARGGPPKHGQNPGADRGPEQHS